jgi:hypothetical protein
MAKIYYAILLKIRRSRFQIWNKKISISKPKKFLLLLSTFLKNRIW